MSRTLHARHCPPRIHPWCKRRFDRYNGWIERVERKLAQAITRKPHMQGDEVMLNSPEYRKLFGGPR